MRNRFMTVAGAVVLAWTTVASAADINQDGANAIRDTLNDLLPNDIARSKPVTVTPAGSRYEIRYELAKLMATLNTATFGIDRLTPFTLFATPQAGGLWNLDGKNSINLVGHATGPDSKRVDFAYSIADMAFNSVFDPEIGYLRSSDMTAKGLELTSSSDLEAVNASCGAMTYTLRTADSAAAAGRLDLAASGTANTFSETITSKQTPPVHISADSVEFDAKIHGVAGKAMKEFILFMLEHADETSLSGKSEREFKTVLGRLFPLLSSLGETVRFNNLAVKSEAGSGGAKAFAYHFMVDGPSRATRIGFAVDAEDVTWDVPAAASYADFLPQAIDIQFGMSGLDFSAFADELMMLKVNASADEGQRAVQRAAEKLLPGRIVKADFPRVAAKSAVYDLEVSGGLQGRIDTQKGVTLNALIVARDYDKTIAAVQQLAKTDPHLNALSMGLLVAKGFAKTDPDGTQRWDVSQAVDGSIVVNGQQIKGPDMQGPERAAP